MLTAAIIEKDDANEILMHKSISSDGKEIWSLPFCIEATMPLDGIASLIKMCDENRVNIEISPADIYESYCDGDEELIVYNSTLLSYISILPEESPLAWVNNEVVESLIIDSRFVDIISELASKFKHLKAIRKILIDTLQSEELQHFMLDTLSIDIVEEKSALKVFVKYESDVYCPFVFRFDFCIEEDDRVSFIKSIYIARMFADGDKTDLYVLFSSCMAIIQRLFLREKVYINYLHFFDDVGINDASLLFQQQFRTFSREELRNKFEKEFIRFIISLSMFGNFFGSFITEIDELNCVDKYQKYLCSENNYNYQTRKELQYYYNADKAISLLCMNNSEYRPDVFQDLKWNIIEGVDGKILCLTTPDNDPWSFNFISLECWEKINLVIRDMNITEYSFLCQNNTLYMFEKNNIWIFKGDFSEYWVNEEKSKISKQQEQQNLLLNLNKAYRWRYPINFGRFEEMMAELYETEPMVERIRLVGKPNCPDGGRDLLIWKLEEGANNSFSRKLIIGQCKAYNRSIGKSDVRDIRDMLEHYNALGFALFSSSSLTTPLIDNLLKLEESFDVDWWTQKEIFKKLRQNSFIADRYTDILDCGEKIEEISISEEELPK